MLSLLKIKNIALIDELTLEFGPGLNLLTGETGSGKSIIIDSLGAVIGERLSGDLIKDGADSAVIEGVFALKASPSLTAVFEEAGIGSGDSDEVIVRRELSAAGKNRIFVNDRVVTQSLLRRIGAELANIHGQGEQTALYDVNSHRTMLDDFAGTAALLDAVSGAFRSWTAAKSDLDSLESDQAEKLQLRDVLRFQVNEIKAAGLSIDEDVQLEEEKLRLNNVEKLTNLSTDAFDLLYDRDESTSVTLEKAERKVIELGEYEAQFRLYADGIASARAVIEDLAIAVRDYRSKLEFSPERLDEIETRLSEITRLKRKYGGSIESVIEHLDQSERRLEDIETAEFREEELKQRLAAARERYLTASRGLHDLRATAAVKFGRQVEKDLAAVALDKARFEARVEFSEASFSAHGGDHIEFFFSANPGESPKPLARVASGGESSRLMLILKTTHRSKEAPGTAVFDEIDIGIGGRVAESVGRKLKELSNTQQVLCVTHQPQIASLADHHFIVEKEIKGTRTVVKTRELGTSERVEEVARMLAGEQITEAARENARSMLAGGV